jgi:tRNA-Thr(GGU) m(6)t(6)A37 methyltransferase TsaA
VTDAAGIAVRPVGHVRSPRTEHGSRGWGGVRARIEMDAARFGPETLQGLDAFSHVIFVFHFHRVAEDDYDIEPRRPRGNPDWPEVGVFARPGRERPNRIGVTVSRLLSVDGTTLTVEGLDALDGTPVLDIKPHFTGFAPRGAVSEPDWSQALMRDYW